MLLFYLVMIEKDSTTLNRMFESYLIIRRKSAQNLSGKAVSVLGTTLHNTSKYDGLASAL